MTALNESNALHTRYLADTHQVENVSCELADYNMYAQDTALREAVQREGAAWASSSRTMPRRVPAAVHSANRVRIAPWLRSCTDRRPSTFAWPVNSAAAAAASPSSSAAAAG